MQKNFLYNFCGLHALSTRRLVQAPPKRDTKTVTTKFTHRIVQNQKFKQFLKIYFNGCGSALCWSKKDQNYDVGAHLNEVVQKKRVIFRTNMQIKEIPVFKKNILYGAVIASPITNQMPQGFLSRFISSPEIVVSVCSKFSGLIPAFGVWMSVSYVTVESI